MTQLSQSTERKPVWRHVLGVSVAWAVLLVGITFFLRAAITPPPALPASAPEPQFSAQRALDLSTPLGLQLPHPAGSSQIELVRSHLSDRLRQLGLQVTETSTTVLSRVDHGIQVGLVTNIMARLPGSSSTRPVLLTTHYDSLEHSPGAGGDTAGVLVILEVLRALRAGPPLRNDVIVMFTDGQQAGHLGASYAVGTDRSLLKTGLILDISNHGNTGTPLLYRTSDGNHRLLQMFARVAPFPSASSLAYELGDLLDEPSDFDIFRTLNVVPSISFGTVGGALTFQQPTDTPSRLSAGLVQQLGANCLALTRSQGDEDLHANPLLIRRNEIFFNWYGNHLVHYPRRLVLPMLFATLVVFCLLLHRSLKDDRYWKRDLLKGLVTAALLFLCAPVSMLCLWWCVNRVTPATLLTSNGTSRLLLFLSFLIFGFAGTAAAYVRIRRNTNTARLVEASLTIGAVLVIDMTMALRESSYICFWPWVVAAFAYLGFHKISFLPSASTDRAPGVRSIFGRSYSGARLSVMRNVIVILGALPGIMLLPFLFYLLFQVMKLDTPFMICGGLLLGGTLLVVLPLLELLIRPQLGWKVPAFLAFLSFSLLGTGFLLRASSVAYPMPDSLLYASNTDTGRSAWVSLYTGESFLLDKWLQQTLTGNPNRGRLPELLGGYDSYVLWKPAPPFKSSLKPPTVEVLKDFGTGQEHFLQLRVAQNALSREVRIHLPAAEIYSVSLGDQKLDVSDPFQPLTAEQKANPDPYVPTRPWVLQFAGTSAHPLDLWLHFRSGECKLLVAERSPGLPVLNGVPVPARPGPYMPDRESDDTVLSRSISFCQQ